jgi:hypothetical protein
MQVRIVVSGNSGYRNRELPDKREREADFCLRNTVKNLTRVRRER